MVKILIADDDADICELVSLKLQLGGYDVTSRHDGVGALRAVQDDPPALVLLDVAMPGMTGLDVCRALRRDPATAHLAVVMLTARSQEADIEAGFAAGADDYIPKPFSPRELLSRVEALLARTPAPHTEKELGYWTASPTLTPGLGAAGSSSRVPSQ